MKKFIEKYEYKLAGMALIIGGIMPILVEKDATASVLLFALGIPMLLAKEEES